MSYRRFIRTHLFLIGIYVFVGVTLVFTLFPVIWLGLLSLKTQLQAFTYPPVFFFKPTAAHYYEVVIRSDFFRFFSNSLIVSLSTTVCSMIVGVPAAYAFHRSRFRFKRHVIGWTLTTRMLPAMVYVVPYFVAFQYLNLIDTRAGLVIAYLTFNLPIVVWTMYGFFAQFPNSVEEAAMIDGASPLKSFIYVVLPISTTGLVATGLIVFMWCWNEFIFALVLTRRQALTATIAIVNFMAYEGIEWGSVAAGAMIVLIPVFFFSILVRRYMARALFSGAVKG